jgi:hypothetical protein
MLCLVDMSPNTTKAVSEVADQWMGWPIVASVVDALRQRFEELDCAVDDWALLQAAEAIAAGRMPDVDPATASAAGAAPVVGRVEPPLRGLPGWPRPHLPFGSPHTRAQRPPTRSAGQPAERSAPSAEE